MADEQVRITLGLDGAQDVARGAATAGSMLAAMGTDAQKAGNQLAQTTAFISQATAQLGRLSPEAARASQAVGLASRALMSLAQNPTLLGGIQALATVGIGAITEALNRAERAAEATQERIAQLARHGEEDFIRLGRAFRQSQQQHEDLFSGRRSVAETQDVLSGLATTLRGIQQERTLAFQAGDEERFQELANRERTLQTQERILQRALAEAQQREGLANERQQLESVYAASDAARAKRDRRVSRGGGNRRDLDEDVQTKIQRAIELSRQWAQEREDMLQAEAVAERERADAELAKEREIYDVQAEAINNLEAKRQESHDAEIARMSERHHKQEEEAQIAFDRYVDIAEKSKEYTQPIVEGLVSVFEQIGSGAASAEDAFKGLLASFLSYIAERAAIEAIAEYAEAVGDFASENYSGGAGHLAAGVLWTGVAVAAGAASGAVSASARPQPASPGASGGVARGGGDRTTVINLTGPVVTAGTRAELGRTLGGLITESQWRYAGAA